MQVQRRVEEIGIQSNLFIIMVLLLPKAPALNTSVLKEFLEQEFLKETTKTYFETLKQIDQLSTK